MSQIRFFREEAQLTQEQLADSLKVDRSTVAKWETGQSVPRVPVLKSMAKLFGTSIDRLLSENESVNEEL